MLDSSTTSPSYQRGTGKRQREYEFVLLSGCDLAIRAFEMNLVHEDSEDTPTMRHIRQLRNTWRHLAQVRALKMLVDAGECADRLDGVVRRLARAATRIARSMYHD